MVTVTLPQERTSGNGEIANTDSSKSSPNGKPIEALPGDSNNRLGNTLPLATATVIPKPNGNGKPTSKVQAPNGRQNGRQALPNDVNTVADSGGRVQEWNISDLKPHRLQEAFFPPETQEADRELAADMDANGQEVPIDILPDGTILCGHRRVAAATRLGWKKE